MFGRGRRMFLHRSISRTRRGQSLVELCVGLLVLVPIILIFFDLAVIVIGVQVNDQTCKQAARAASSGDPASASQRAQAIVARANQQGSSMLSNFSLTGVIFNPATVVADAAALVPYGGTISGTVTVNTTVDIRPFLVPYVYSGGAPLTFRSSQAYPFTFVVPNTAPVVP